MTTQTQYLVRSMHERPINNQVIPKAQLVANSTRYCCRCAAISVKNIVCLCFLIPHFTHRTGRAEKRPLWRRLHVFFSRRLKWLRRCRHIEEKSPNLLSYIMSRSPNIHHITWTEGTACNPHTGRCESLVKGTCKDVMLSKESKKRIAGRFKCKWTGGTGTDRIAW